MAEATTDNRRQLVNFSFFQVDPAWRRLPQAEREQGKHEFCQVVQDYSFVQGEPLTQPDIDERRAVVALGMEVAEKLFDDPAYAVGKKLRIGGREMTVKGVVGLSLFWSIDQPIRPPHMG